MHRLTEMFWVLLSVLALRKGNDNKMMQIFNHPFEFITSLPMEG